MVERAGTNGAETGWREAPGFGIDYEPPGNDRELPFEQRIGMPDSEHEAFHLAGDRLGKFVILDELGRGSMGVVYEAFQEDLKRKVAIKILPANIALDAKQVRRFRREAESMARLQHEHIIPIYEVGEIDATHYFAMEKIDGTPFGDNVGRDRDSIQEAARVAMCAAQGLAHAHEQGVIHRDVKPSNLLVDRSQRVLVTDFGLAHLTDSASLTSTDAIVGTPKYMAPEQILPGTENLDGRADVYSLGATLYHVVAGRAPFEEPSVQAFIKAILEERAPTPRKFNRQVPIDLATIILRCLEKAPRDRYPSARELALDLQRFINGERIHAKPKGAVAIAFETVRRHKMVAVLAAAVIITLLATVFFGGQAAEAREQNKVTARITDIQAMPDTAVAVTAIDALLKDHPNDKNVKDARKLLYRRHAKLLLEQQEVEWGVIVTTLEAGAATDDFWYATALVEERRFDAAQEAAEQFEPGHFIRRIINARLRLERGEIEVVRTILDDARKPSDHAPISQRVFFYLTRAEASLAAATASGINDETHLRLAEADLGEAERAADSARERWLRTRVQLRGLALDGKLGNSIGDWTKRVLAGVGAIQELGNVLTNWWGRMTPGESRIAREFVESILALAKQKPQPPTVLRATAVVMVNEANTDRERVVSHLLLAVAELSQGNMNEAEDALAVCENYLFGANDGGLSTFVYWASSLVRRAENDVAEALRSSLDAVKAAAREAAEADKGKTEFRFPRMQSLAHYVTILIDEARRREMTEQADNASQKLRESIAGPLKSRVDGPSILERLKSGG